ncbi:hypothetical protein [Thalassospira sp. CH_XMU1448-2]|uniref:hypothetical protein n=1 Tax=Thalassospira sp. CH_XMU1448-2 TaxID=3107773 RepID=UPI00300AEA14
MFDPMFAKLLISRQLIRISRRRNLLPASGCGDQNGFRCFYRPKVKADVTVATGETGFT